MISQLQQLGFLFCKLYGDQKDVLNQQFERHENLIGDHRERFGNGEIHLFSTPGRTEIGGNHTDHNRGRILAGSINLDAIAAASLNANNEVRVFSFGYETPWQVKLTDLEVREEERGTTAALIRGIAANFKSLGYRIGGFDATITSDVLPSSGLSSSAVIEVLIATIFSVLFNEAKVSRESIAKIGQIAEDVYYGKPCGLMDQMTCAMGGIISIDFEDPQKPRVKKLNFNFEERDFSVLVVETGSDLTDFAGDYAAIPREMKSVAQAMGQEVCKQISMQDLLAQMPQLRAKVGDRAILRALHFLREDERVEAQVAALQAGDLKSFLTLVQASGNSSAKWLQNVYSPSRVQEQGLTLALAMTEDYLARIPLGACRVHGGGFAGTMQVFMPNEYTAEYAELMQSAFGEDAVLKLSIRPQGTLHLTSRGIR